MESKSGILKENRSHRIMRNLGTISSQGHLASPNLGMTSTASQFRKTKFKTFDEAKITADMNHAKGKLPSILGSSNIHQDGVKMKSKVNGKNFSIVQFESHRNTIKEDPQLLSSIVKRNTLFWNNSIGKFYLGGTKEDIIKMKKEEIEINKDLNERIKKQRVVYKINKKPARFIEPVGKMSTTNPKDPKNMTEEELYKISKRNASQRAGKTSTFLDTFYNRNGIMTSKIQGWKPAQEKYERFEKKSNAGSPVHSNANNSNKTEVDKARLSKLFDGSQSPYQRLQTTEPSSKPEVTSEDLPMPELSIKEKEKLGFVYWPLIETFQMKTDEQSEQPDNGENPQDVSIAINLCRCRSQKLSWDNLSRNHTQGTSSMRARVEKWMMWSICSRSIRLWCIITIISG